MSSLWHPFADMASVKDDEFVISRGSGARVWDEQGASTSTPRAACGTARSATAAPRSPTPSSAQMRELAVYDIFASTANRPAIELADRVAALAPFADGAVFFTSGGSDAVDTAGKLALRYWHALGKPDKRTIVHRERSLPRHERVRHQPGRDRRQPRGLRRADPRHGLGRQRRHRRAGAPVRERGDQIAAFIGEPVIGAGGIYAPGAGYWQRVQELCRAHDVLLIADEVICGFGRLGTWFGCHRFGIAPDMITCAKGITSGYLPLGAVIASPRLQEPFWTTPGAALFRHGSRTRATPACARPGSPTSTSSSARGCWSGSRGSSRCWTRPSQPLARLPLVSEVRSGVGLLAAVEIAPDARAAEPGVVDRIVQGLPRAGRAHARPGRPFAAGVAARS